MGYVITTVASPLISGLQQYQQWRHVSLWASSEDAEGVHGIGAGNTHLWAVQLSVDPLAQ